MCLSRSNRDTAPITWMLIQFGGEIDVRGRPEPHVRSGNERPHAAVRDLLRLRWNLVRRSVWWAAVLHDRGSTVRLDRIVSALVLTSGSEIRTGDDPGIECSIGREKAEQFGHRLRHSPCGPGPSGGEWPRTEPASGRTPAQPVHAGVPPKARSVSPHWVWVCTRGGDRRTRNR